MIRREVRDFLERRGCPQDELVLTEVALVEACNNAIEYVADGARHLPIIVEASCPPDYIELSVTDNTAGFDWPKQTALPHEASESGRGLFLIRHLMDSAEYSRGDKCNKLVLRKQRRHKQRS